LEVLEHLDGLAILVSVRLVDDAAQELDRAIAVSRAVVELRERELDRGVGGQQPGRALERLDARLGRLIPDRVGRTAPGIALRDVGGDTDTVDASAAPRGEPLVAALFVLRRAIDVVFGVLEVVLPIVRSQLQRASVALLGFGPSLVDLVDVREARDR